MQVFVADRFGGWQEDALAVLAAAFNAEAKTFPPDAEVRARGRTGVAPGSDRVRTGFGTGSERVRTGSGPAQRHPT